MKTLPVLAAIVIALGWSETALAQGEAPSQAMAGRIAEARRANAALMAYAEVTVPAGQLSVQVQNRDYNRGN